MSHPKWVLLVKFSTTLSLDEILEIANSRADEFRALPGLKEKYYLQDKESGDIAGLYLWESAEALDEYRKSELRASIAAAYRATGEPRVETFEVLMPLRATEFQ
jgi:heme-degrading monooxygenase HmoA